MRQNYFNLIKLGFRSRFARKIQLGSWRKPWKDWEPGFGANCPCFQDSRSFCSLAFSRQKTSLKLSTFRNLHKSREETCVVKMVRLSDYDCIGFDLDHTLIQYKLDNLYQVSNNMAGLKKRAET